ncbi:unnamed protein product, partial [Amoebophrya sp. A25]|eukprot:GSA25T00002501001.1
MVMPLALDAGLVAEEGANCPTVSGDIASLSAWLLDTANRADSMFCAFKAFSEDDDYHLARGIDSPASREKRDERRTTDEHVHPASAPHEVKAVWEGLYVRQAWERTAARLDLQGKGD